MNWRDSTSHLPNRYGYLGNLPGIQPTQEDLSGKQLATRSVGETFTCLKMPPLITNTAPIVCRYYESETLEFPTSTPPHLPSPTAAKAVAAEKTAAKQKTFRSTKEYRNIRPQSDIGLLLFQDGKAECIFLSRSVARDWNNFAQDGGRGSGLFSPRL